MNRIFLLSALLSLGNILPAQQYTISGYVRDFESGENLIGANVYNKTTGEGTSTNQYGYYSLTLSADSISLVYSYVGYQPQKMKFYLDQDTTVTVELRVGTLSEVVISGSTGEAIEEQTLMSTVDVPLKEVKKLPALLGETDVLKVIQLLPGVQSGSEGTSGIYVRGGGPDQNLILLDGVPVYNVSHLFGFFSVFNADAINNVQLTKGGFPARYGGRLSSVIDITMKEGNKKELHGEGAIGLVASKIALEGPIDKGRTSFIVSGRRTYLDLLARPIIKAASSDDLSSGYYFYDLNAKINHKFSDRDHLYLSAYLGDDEAYSTYENDYIENNTKYDYKDKYGLKWGNIISALRWNHIWNKKLFSNTTFTYSRYRFKVFEDYQEEITTLDSSSQKFFYNEYQSGIRDFAAKIDLEFLPNPDHYIRFGISGIHHMFNPGIFSYQDFMEADTTLGSVSINALEFAAYLEDDFRIGEKLKINTGLHLSGFKVNDEFYHSLQPRLGLRYLINNNLSLKASYADMTQYIHLLTNSGIGLPTDLWVPVTPDVPPQNSSQAALGFAKTFMDQFEVSIEGYYKWMDNLIEYKEGATYLDLEQDWQDKIENGQGKSYGAEFFIQKKTGNLSGWFGYTLSWTNRQFANLNFGRTFPYKYDRRHDVSLAVTRKVRSNFDFSLAWVYGTGNAITLPTAVYPKFSRNYYYGYYSQSDGYYYSSDIKHYEGRNGFRMPAYHRLDISISWKKEKKWGERTWTLAFYNLYNRKNPFFIDTGYDDEGNKKFIQYSLFPVIPSVRYSFKF